MFALLFGGLREADGRGVGP